MRKQKYSLHEKDNLNQKKTYSYHPKFAHFRFAVLYL